MAILDVRKSLSISFLSISHRYATLIIFKICTKWLTSDILDVQNSLSIAFLAISDRYITLIFVEIFDKMAAVGHFGCPNFTLDHISGHFRSIQILFYFLQNGFFFTMDVQKSLSISFLAISDRCTTLIFFYKMAAGGHFGCPKITFNLISIHFTSIRNFNFFFKFLQNG